MIYRLRMKRLLIPALLSSLVLLAGCAQLDTMGGSANFACKNYQTQPEAQRAWQQAGSPAKNDSNGDGIVCTSLPKSASSAASGGSSGDTTKTTNCQKTEQPRVVTVSRSKYPETSLHIEKAIEMGQPAVLTIDRADTDQKRDQWHQVISKGWDYDKDGQTDDMDEWPMAFTQEGGRNANIALVDPSDNRGAGSSIAGQLRNYCEGQKFKLQFYGNRPQLTRILIVANNGKRVNIEAGN